MRIVRSVVCLLVFVATVVAKPSESTEPPLDIGSRVELFVDDYLIESTEGVRLKLHQPRSAGKVLSFDQPWEGNTSYYPNVFQDGDRYRMYYRGTQHGDYLMPPDPDPKDHPPIIAYAESRDGIRWERPNLGIFEFEGSRDNNIVWIDKPGDQTITDCMYVFRDTNPACPDSQRYKALGGSSFPLVALVSADGLHWTELQGQKSLITEGLHDNPFDNLTVVFWEPRLNRYVMFLRDAHRGGENRPPAPRNFGNRSIKYSTSPDFIEWDDPEWVDFGGTPLEEMYTNGITRYSRAPHIYLAFPKRFVPWRTLISEVPHEGVSDAVFMSSRDGLHWDRRFMEAFIRPGRDRRNWVHRNNMPALGILPTAADEISLYVVRNYTFPTVHLERMVVRTDGFVSAHAGYEAGELLTKPLVFKGDNLVLNFATSAAGSIRLEIQDSGGNPLPGFALEESPLIWGDEIEHTVSWKRSHAKATSDKPLAWIAGKPVRLKFVMKDADLFSLRFR